MRIFESLEFYLLKFTIFGVNQGPIWCFSNRADFFSVGHFTCHASYATMPSCCLNWCRKRMSGSANWCTQPPPNLAFAQTAETASGCAPEVPES